VNVDIAACRDSRADIAFVLDASGSIVYETPNSTLNLINWNLMKAFVVTLIRSLRVSQSETRVALVRFSHQSSVVFQLDRYSTAEQAVQVTLALVYRSTVQPRTTPNRLMATAQPPSRGGEFIRGTGTLFSPRGP